MTTHRIPIFALISAFALTTCGEPPPVQPDPYCGDGVVDDGEACDDGAANSDTEADACRTDCTAPACGDGVVDDGEACDDGDANSDSEADACRVDCTAPACGDGVVDAGEGCDDGAANSDTVAGACRTTCAPATCGDGVLDEGEACDDGSANSDTEAGACRTTCVAAWCGDEVIDDGEVCDDGDANSDTAPDACRVDCTAPSCGDGVVDDGEACDDGDANSDTAPDACRTTCTAPFCGDGVADSGEGCDDGAANSDTAPGACRTTCAPATCGDGVVDDGEGCDDGAANSDTAPDACRTTCVAAWCGDEVIDDGEVCDDGAANSDTAPDACRTTCAAPFCGDGVADTGEACDDGAANSDTAPDACRTDCAAPACGDGVLDTAEACDDGGTAPGDGCSASCEWEVPEQCTATSHAPVNLHRDGTPDGGNGFTYAGTTVGAPAVIATSCGGYGGEVLHGYVVNETGDLVVTLTAGPDLNATLSVDAECGVQDSGLACVPESIGSGSPGEERMVIVEDVDPGTGLVFIHVDSFFNAEGAYELNVHVAPPLALSAACASDGHLGRCDTTAGPAVCADPDGDGQGTCAPVHALGEACDPAGVTAVCEPSTWCNPGTSVCAPACGNALLDEGEQCDDGNLQGGDGCSPSCMFEGGSCADPYNLANAYHPATMSWIWVASTAAFSGDYEAGCVSGSVQADGVARFTAPTDGDYTVSLETDYDAVLYAWDGACGQSAPELACSQRGGSGTTEHLSLSLLAGDIVYLVVDGWGTYVSDTNTGPFVLTVSQPVCGDGLVQGREQCDDGNTAPNDGCDATCRAEYISESEPNDTAASAETLTVGDVFRATLVPAGDHDYYALSADAGTTYTFETYVGSYGECYHLFGTSHDTLLRLYDVDGTTELDADDDGGLGGTGGCSRLTWTAPSTDTYFLRVQYFLDTTSETIEPYFLELRSP